MLVRTTTEPLGAGCDPFEGGLIIVKAIFDGLAQQGYKGAGGCHAK